MLLEHPFEDLICVVQILTDNDVERRICPRPALAQARNDVWNDEFEDPCAHSCRHDIAIGDGLGGRFLIVAADCRDVFNEHVLIALAGNVAHRVAVLLLQCLNHRLRHVDECDLVAGLAECRADKAAANVAAAIHNCLLHLFAYLSLFV